MNYTTYIDLVKNIVKYNISDDITIDDKKIKKELGFDSILLVKLLIEIEDIIGEEIPFDSLGIYDDITPKELWMKLNLNYNK